MVEKRQHANNVKKSDIDFVMVKAKIQRKMKTKWQSKYMVRNFKGHSGQTIGGKYHPPWIHQRFEQGNYLLTDTSIVWACQFSIVASQIQAIRVLIL